MWAEFRGFLKLKLVVYTVTSVPYRVNKHKFNIFHQLILYK
jgi:hypothetical protein